MKQKVLVLWYGISHVSIAQALRDFEFRIASCCDNKNTWYLELCRTKDNYKTQVNKIHHIKPGKTY